VPRLPTAKLAEFEPAPDSEDTTRRYPRSLQLGLGDPQLPLLTEGSQIFRMIVPRSEAQQLRVFRFYDQAMPCQLIRLDAWRLAVFRPGVPDLPIVLRRADNGRWFVDEPKVWAYFNRYEDGVDFFPKYDDLLFLPALRRSRQPNAGNAIYRGRVRTPAAPVYPFSLTARSRSRSERSKNAPPTTGCTYHSASSTCSR
jgi:hypothetical protein